MASIVRATLRRNNHLANNLLRLSQPPLSSGSPRGSGVSVLTRLRYYSSSNGGGAPESRLPPHLQVKCEMRPSDDPYDDDDKLPEGYCKPNTNTRQDEKATYFKAEMPGVSKEDTKVYLQGNLLVLKGVRKYDPEFDEGEVDAKGAPKTTKTTYLASWGFAPHKHNISEIKSVMKDGLLKVTVPKFKDEEHADSKLAGDEVIFVSVLISCFITFLMLMVMR